MTVLRTTCPECHQHISVPMGDTAAQVEAAVLHYAEAAEGKRLPPPVNAVATAAIDLARAFDLEADGRSIASLGKELLAALRALEERVARDTGPDSFTAGLSSRDGRPRETRTGQRWGARIGEVAARLGRPLMPWQQQVADVATELDESGALYYRNIRVLVPRQQGKTALELAVAVHRANAWPDQVITYAAQTRIKAREKWQEDHVKTLNRSPFGPQGGRYTVSLANGNEAIHWRNGSRHGIAAATDTSGHGDVLDLAFVDEAWAHVDNRLEQAFQPAMLTRTRPGLPGAQLWDVSTAGNHRSLYLRRKVTQGRALVEDGGPIRIAYFEWSAPPEADPEDEATWWSCMPALGHTIHPDAVRSMLDSMELAEFRRACLNQWPDEQPQGLGSDPPAGVGGLRRSRVAAVGRGRDRPGRRRQPGTVLRRPGRGRPAHRGRRHRQRGRPRPSTLRWSTTGPASPGWCPAWST